jgi:hypothetical protein
MRARKGHSEIKGGNEMARGKMTANEESKNRAIKEALLSEGYAAPELIIEPNFIWNSHSKVWNAAMNEFKKMCDVIQAESDNEEWPTSWNGYDVLKRLGLKK